MINLDRVAQEIKTVGLYDLVLQDVQKIAQKKRLNQKEILDILDENPKLLEDYMQTNVEYNITNIHLKNIEINDLKDECKTQAKQVNENISLLKDLEKFTLDFEQSATLVIIFSIEFFVLFSVQYFIVLLDLKEWQLWIYALFASSVAVAWIYGKKQSNLFSTNKKIYDEKYIQTLKLLDNLESKSCIKKSELMIAECEEHV